MCGSQCVELATDPSHCGGCARACLPTQTCSAGTCQALPADCRQAPCPLSYYCDLANGQCKSGCASNTDCPQPGTCDVATHACSCEIGHHRCGTSCVSDTSISQCGASCTQCAPPANGSAVCRGGGCDFECAVGHHRCGNTCPSNTSPSSCGSSCTPCPAPANGVATCDGVSCGFTCNPGYHRCGSSCLPNNSLNSCGSSCTPCPAPTANGTATCDGVSCKVACDVGYHACSGQCLSNSSVGSCGSSCTPCPVPANAVATCDGVSCGFTCSAGYHRCGSQCISNSSPLGCGSSCTPCPTDPNGTATCSSGVCGIQCSGGYLLCAGACRPCPTAGATTFACSASTCVATACAQGYHLCSGACVSSSSINHCGSSCTPCAPPPNATATCDGTSCDFVCRKGFSRCGASCAYLAHDSQHCGACNSPCPSGFACAQGTCAQTCTTTFSFDAGQVLDAGLSVQGVAVVDFDEDGALDLVLGSAGQSDAGVHWMKGTGQGTFLPPLELLNLAPYSYVRDLRSHDFNHDGHADLSLVAQTTNYQGSASQMWWGRGDGGLSRAPQPPLSANSSYAFADFTRDGRGDLLVALWSDRTCRVYPAVDAGVWGTPRPPFYCDSWMPAVTDLDVDGRLDVANTYYSELRTQRGLGNGDFGPSVGLALQFGVAIASGDVNRDGLPDVLVATNTNVYHGARLYWALGNGDGTLRTPSFTALSGGSGQVTSLRVVDVDGDGRSDVLAGGYAGAPLSWIRGLADGGLAPVLGVAVPGNSVEIHPARLDADPWLDLVLLDTSVSPARAVLLFGSCQ